MGSYGVTYVVNDLQINRYKVLKQLRQSKQRYVSGRKSFEQENDFTNIKSSCNS